MTRYVDDAAILAVALVYIDNIVSVGFSDQQDSDGRITLDRTNCFTTVVQVCMTEQKHVRVFKLS